MFSIGVAAGVCAVVAVVLGSIWFALLRRSKHRFTGFIIFAALSAGVLFSLPNRVYVLDESVAERYYEKLLLFSSEFVFKNGQAIMLEPQLGQVHVFILNDTQDQHTYQTVMYSAVPFGYAPPEVLLEPYSVYEGDKLVEYIYKDPPQQMSSRSKVEMYGWIQ